MIHPRHHRAQEQAKRDAEVNDHHHHKRAAKAAAKVGEPRDGRGEEQLVCFELVVPKHRRADKAGQDHLTDGHENEKRLGLNKERVPHHLPNATTDLHGICGHKQKRKAKEDEGVEPGDESREVVANLKTEDRAEHQTASVKPARPSW